jgi:prepilin-type N-terminal cleavage/methylation domain-containing protein
MKTGTKPRRRAGNRGFSILEALVAIAILLIALTGPMVFAQQSLRAARLARDQVTAFYLAQDAIELVKHVRDDNSVNGTLQRYEWLSGLEECFAGGSDDNGCRVSTSEWTPADTSGAIDACVGSGNCPLYERTPVGGGKLYGIFGAAEPESRFSREVKIMTPEGGDPTLETEEVMVEVRVWWSTLGLTDPDKQVLVREHVYNWIQ